MKKLVQYNTLGTLMAGLVQGTASIDSMLQYGDMGIGTLDGLDGEVIIINGEAYQGASDGKLNKLTGRELVPYLAVTHFEPDQQLAINNPISSKITYQIILGRIRSEHLFSSIKLTGVFKKMHIRIVPKQYPPYPRMVEVTRRQPEFEERDVKGTIVGFYTPESFQGIAAAGLHLHFISDDRTFGGHVMDFELSKGLLELGTITDFEQKFPDNPEFLDADIDYDNIAADIREAE